MRPDAIVRWMGEHATVEPRPDGRFELTIRGTPVRGQYVVVDPPHRVVFTWGYAGSARLGPGASTVEVRLVPAGNGTRVELEHRDLPPAEQRGHVVGWAHYLDRLTVAGAGRDAGPDPGMPDPDSAQR